MTQAGTRDEANQGLSIRFERSLSLETPAATPCRQVPERLGEPVTADDVAYVHTLIELAIERGLTKTQTIAVLSKHGVHATVTSIVWTKLEEQNPEFFEVYAAVERERLNNNGLSRCSSSCSLSTTQDVNNSNLSPRAGLGLCL